MTITNERGIRLSPETLAGRSSAQMIAPRLVMPNTQKRRSL